MVVIHALLFLLVARLVDGFHVASFWSAVGGAVVVSVTNMVLSILTRGPRGPGRGSGGRKEKPADVIDV
jgi:putative membrane protein